MSKSVLSKNSHIWKKKRVYRMWKLRRNHELWTVANLIAAFFPLIDWRGSLSLPTTPHWSCLPSFSSPTLSLHVDYSNRRVLFVKCFVICTSRKVTICNNSKVEHPPIGVMQIVFHSYCKRLELSKHLPGSQSKKYTLYLSSYMYIYLKQSSLK